MMEFSETVWANMPWDGWRESLQAAYKQMLRSHSHMGFTRLHLLRQKTQNTHAQMHMNNYDWKQWCITSSSSAPVALIGTNPYTIIRIQNEHLNVVLHILHPRVCEGLLVFERCKFYHQRVNPRLLAPHHTTVLHLCTHVSSWCQVNFEKIKQVSLHPLPRVDKGW